jgi:hypothetical protein
MFKNHFFGSEFNFLTSMIAQVELLCKRASGYKAEYGIEARVYCVLLSSRNIFGRQKVLSCLPLLSSRARHTAFSHDINRLATCNPDSI